MTAIAPGSDEWLQTISPSKVAAILGLSRWESAYRLWHRMKGLVPPEEPKDAFNVGHAAEHMLAELWRIENPGWQLSPGEVQVKHSRFGFPVLATPDRRARRGAHRRIVEFKIARDLSDLEEWGDVNLDGEIPVDYQAQLLAQMHFTGYTKHAAHLMVMGPYFQHRTYVVEYDPVKGMAIEDKVAEFWDSLDTDTPPPLDDSVATYNCLRQLHPHIKDEWVAQIDPILAAEYLETGRQIKDLTETYQGLKNRVTFAMGEAKAGVAGTLPVASRRKSGKTIALYPDAKTSPADLRALLDQSPKFTERNAS